MKLKKKDFWNRIDNVFFMNERGKKKERCLLQQTLKNDLLSTNKNE